MATKIRNEPLWNRIPRILIWGATATGGIGLGLLLHGTWIGWGYTGLIGGCALGAIIGHYVARGAGRLLRPCWFNPTVWRIQPYEKRFIERNGKRYRRAIITREDPPIPFLRTYRVFGQMATEAKEFYPISGRIWWAMAMICHLGGAAAGMWIARDATILGIIWGGGMGGFIGHGPFLLYSMTLHPLFGSIEWGDRIVRDEEARGIHRTPEEHRKIGDAEAEHSR